MVWASNKNRGGIEDRNGNGVLDPGEDFPNHGAPNGVEDPGEDVNGDGIFIPALEDLPNNGEPNGVLDPPQAIHTNFALSAGDPESVVLSQSNSPTNDPWNLDSFPATIIDEFTPGVTPNFGPQRTDVSFARYPTAEGLTTGYMILPRPGGVVPVGDGDLGPSGQYNATGALGFTDPPAFTATSSPPGLYEDTVATAAFASPSADTHIYFTTNSTLPTRYSELYAEPFETERTLIIRAIAARDGYLPSASITRSYLFKEDILGTADPGTLPTDHQGARDSGGGFLGLLRGYPEESEDPDFPLRYDMQPEVIRDFRPQISSGLDEVPIVSLVSSVPVLFDVESGGIYPNSKKADGPGPDPLGKQWERLCSFEFIEEDGSEPIQVNAGLEMTGASSRRQEVTRKHNMRVRFHSRYGPESLDYQLFDGVAIDTFSDFHLKNTTHDSWAQNFTSWENYSNHASYCDEGWLREAHRAMGHLNPHRRWVQLFINGIYWGPYELTERVNDEFVRRHEGAPEGATYDVLRPSDTDDPVNFNGVAAVDGTTHAWDRLIEKCNDLKSSVDNNQSAANQNSIYHDIANRMDIANYIDYLLCYTYSHGKDWPGSNFRIARRTDAGDTRFRFYVWDAELAFEPGSYLQNAANRIVGPKVADPHSMLRHYGGYQEIFAGRIRLHFFKDDTNPLSGSLARTMQGDQAVQLYQAEMAKVSPLLQSESARWGALRPNILYTVSDPSYLPGDSRQGDWNRTTSHVVNTWLPERRQRFLNDFSAADLYAAVETDALPEGDVGNFFQFPLTLVGGGNLDSSTLLRGALPPGLFLANNVISGTPTTGGIYSFVLEANSTETIGGVDRTIEGLTEFTLTISPTP